MRADAVSKSLRITGRFFNKIASGGFSLPEMICRYTSHKLRRHQSAAVIMPSLSRLEIASSRKRIPPPVRFGQRLQACCHIDRVTENGDAGIGPLPDGADYRRTGIEPDAQLRLHAVLDAKLRAGRFHLLQN
jgi:hypothetical protein